MFPSIRRKQEEDKDAADAKAAMLLDRAMNFEVPIGPFKGQKIRDVYEQNYARLAWYAGPQYVGKGQEKFKAAAKYVIDHMPK